ncbi:MAG TPA: O-antigen ligase family protein [Acidimicrobiales bacterium]|nr:O-antigen ligase family protein [Acidimicrobiales bacterium]
MAHTVISEGRWRAARRGVLIVLLVAVPVVFDTGVRPVFALPKLTVATLGAVVLLVLGAGERALRRPGRLRTNPLAVPVVLLVVWAAVSAVASPDPVTSLVGHRESLNGVLTTTVLAVLFFAAADGFDVSGVRMALSVLWFGGACVVLAYGALQLADRVTSGFHLDPIEWMNTPDGAIWSTLGNPNDLGGFLALVLPVGLVLLVLARRPATRALTAVMVLLLVVELGATMSRGAMLGAGAGVTLFAAWCGSEVWTRHRVVAVGAVALLTAGLAVAGLIVTGGHTEKGFADVLRTGEGTTISLRVEVWRTALRMAEEDPVFGVGPDLFGRSFDAFRSQRFVRDYGPDLLATDAHNLLLTTLATRGIPGLILLLVLLGSTARLFARTRQRLRRRPGMWDSSGTRESHIVVAALGAATLAYVVQALFNRGDLTLDFCFWVLLGLACAVARAAGAEDGSMTGGPSASVGAQQSGEGDDGGQTADDEGDPGDRAPFVPVV